MLNYLKIGAISSLVLIIFGCKPQECNTKINPYYNTLNVVLDSVFKDTEIKRLWSVHNHIHEKNNSDYFQYDINKCTGDTLFVLNKVLENFSVASPHFIQKVKPKYVRVDSYNNNNNGTMEVSNYYYDESRKLGAYFFIVMLGVKGEKDFVVYYTMDEDCQVKLLSYKEFFTIPKNPIWVKKMKGNAID